MSLEKKERLTEADEARLLELYLVTPFEELHRWRRELGVKWSDLKREFPGLRPDQYQGNHPQESEMRVLERTIHLAEISIEASDAIRTRLARIQASHSEASQKSLSEIYEVYAVELLNRGEKLPDAVVKEAIPNLVFAKAVDLGWIPYPLHRRGKWATNAFLKEWFAGPSFKRSKKKYFGPYRVPQGFGSWFKAKLQTRINQWESKAGPFPGTNPTGAIDSESSAKNAGLKGDDGECDRRAAVNSYIEEVLRETGKRITRTDIWKTAGDKTRTEFERWESCWYEKHGKKGNRSADCRFRRILNDKPHLK